MGVPLPWDSRPVGNPVVTSMERVVRLGATSGAYALGSLPNLRRRERSATEVTSCIFSLTFALSMSYGVTASGMLRWVWISTRSNSGSLCTHHAYRTCGTESYIPSGFSALMPCSCPLWVSPPSQALSWKSFAPNFPRVTREFHTRL